MKPSKAKIAGAKPPSSPSMGLPNEVNQAMRPSETNFLARFYEGLARNWHRRAMWTLIAGLTIVGATAIMPFFPRLHDASAESLLRLLKGIVGGGASLGVFLVIRTFYVSRMHAHTCRVNSDMLTKFDETTWNDPREQKKFIAQRLKEMNEATSDAVKKSKASAKKGEL